MAIDNEVKRSFEVVLDQGLVIARGIRLVLDVVEFLGDALLFASK